MHAVGSAGAKGDAAEERRLAEADVSGAQDNILRTVAHAEGYHGLQTRPCARQVMGNRDRQA